MIMLLSSDYLFMAWNDIYTKLCKLTFSISDKIHIVDTSDFSCNFGLRQFTPKYLFLSMGVTKSKHLVRIQTEYIEKV